MFDQLADPTVCALSTALQHTRARLTRAISYLAAQPDSGFAEGWASMVAATEATFRQEETIMDLAGYAGLPAHIAQDARVLAALHHVTAPVEAGDTGIGRQALAALAAIVATHRYAVSSAAINVGRHAPAPARDASKHLPQSTSNYRAT
jgi:hypothetical protein